FFIFWIFKPLDLFPRKTDPDKIHPTISVHIHPVADKSIAIALIVLKLFRGFYLMLLPVRRFKPIGAGHDINLSILVDIPHCHSLGDKVLQEHMFLERNPISRDFRPARAYGFTLEESS